MQEDVAKTEALAKVEGGGENENMCLLARIFNGFANSTRLSILLLAVHRELRGGDPERITATVVSQGVA